MAFRLADAYVQFSQRGLSGVNSNINQVTRGFTGAIGVAGRFAATLGIGGGGLGLAGATVVAATFEQQMSAVKAITGATGDEFEQLQGIAREMGATTSFSASEAAKAEEFLAMAGFNTGQIIASLPGVLALAQAGKLDLATAADIASNALTGMNLEAEQSNRIADVLAQTAASSNTNVMQLGNAFKFVAPVAAGMNVEVEEVAASIGALSDAGLQGEMAGTGLRKILSVLADPSEDLRKKMGGLRVEAHGLAAVLREIGEVDTATAMQEFGERGGPAFQILSGGADKVAGLTSKLEESEGAAKSMADTMTDNLIGSSKEAQSALQELILQGGIDNGAIDSIRTTMDELTAFLRSDAAGAAAASTAASVADVFDQVSRVLQGVVNHSDDVVDAFGAMIATSEVLFGAAGQVTDVFGDLFNSLGDADSELSGVSESASDLATGIDNAQADSQASTENWADDLRFFARNFDDLWGIAVSSIAFHMASISAEFQQSINDYWAWASTVGDAVGTAFANTEFANQLTDQIGDAQNALATLNNQEVKTEEDLKQIEILERKIARLKKARAEVSGDNVLDGHQKIESEQVERPDPEAFGFDQHYEKIAQREAEFEKRQQEREAAREEARRKREEEAAARKSESDKRRTEREETAETERQKRLWNAQQKGQKDRDKQQKAELSGAEELFARQVTMNDKEVRAAMEKAAKIAAENSKMAELTDAQKRQKERNEKLAQRGLQSPDRATSEDRQRERQEQRQQAIADRELNQFTDAMDRFNASGIGSILTKDLPQRESPAPVSLPSGVGQDSSLDGVEKNTSETAAAMDRAATAIEQLHTTVKSNRNNGARLS